MLVLAIPVALLLVVAHSCVSGQLAARLCTPHPAHNHHIQWQHDGAPVRAAWHVLQPILWIGGYIMDMVGLTRGMHVGDEDDRWTGRMCAVLEEYTTPAHARTCAWLLVAWAVGIVVVAVEHHRYV